MAGPLIAGLLATSTCATLLGSWFGAQLYRKEAETQRARDLAAYAEERTKYEQTLFLELWSRHGDAGRALSRLATARVPEPDVSARFDQAFPRRADGTRRAARALEAGGPGQPLYGLTAFMAGPEPSLAEKARLLQAAEVVVTSGEAFRSRFDNFYFFSPDNRMIMFTPDAPGKIRFYREEAPATLDFASSEMMRITLPQNNPKRRTRCTKLLPLLSDPSGKTLTTGCMTPVYIGDQYIGAWGTTLPLSSYLLDAVQGSNRETVNLIASADGGLIAYPGFSRPGQVTPARLNTYEQTYQLAEVMAQIRLSQRPFGVTRTPDGAYLMAYGRIIGPDWYFLTAVSQASVVAAANRSATPLLTFGLLASLGQAVAAFWWTRRLIAHPLARLARDAEADGPISDQSLDARPDEIGVLARALGRERQARQALLQDLEQRVADRTREAEAASQAKSVFLANMSHEIRTPLTAVIGFSALLKDRPDLAGEARQYAERIDMAGRALLGLINDILDFSKLEAGEMVLHPVATDVTSLGRETLELFQAQAADKGLALEFLSTLEPDPRLVDPQALRQVLTNLISNAVKFTDTGYVRLSLAAEAGDLRISVSDTGPGLSGDEQARLFKRFSQVDNAITRKHGGTGLGLALCRALLNTMDGDITVQSQLGQGSTFSCCIPAPVVSAPEADDAAPAPIDVADLRILVPDDNPVNLELVQVILQALGAEVSTAADGAQAVARAAERTFDLILMDLRMPVLDGYAALKTIRSAPGPSQHTPVFAFSADVREGLDLSAFDGVVSKPITPLGLLEALQPFGNSRA